MCFSYFFPLFPLFSRFPHVSPLPHLYWFPSFFVSCFLLNINNEYVTVYIVLIALFFIYFLILNYSPFPPYSSASSVCVYFLLPNKNKSISRQFYFTFFSRSDFVSHVSSTDNTRNIVPQLCLCVCGVCELETKRKMKSFKWWQWWFKLKNCKPSACACMLLPFVHARASVIVASVVVLCCYCCCENSNQTIPLKLIKTFNTSPCLFSLYCFIELLNLLPLLFRSVVVV